jgi:DNA-binding HxlR family transcriptional regulator
MSAEAAYGQPPSRPVLRAVPDARDSGGGATASDLELIEAASAATSLFSAKWKIDLLFVLAAGVRRHGHLRGHLLVSKKVLSEALRSLERDGLVRRQVFGEIPVRVEYSLTPLGRSLTGPLFALSEWANDHYEAVLASRREVDLRDGTACHDAQAPRFTAAFRVRGEIAS